MHVSLTHQISIATLINFGAHASAFALLRPQIDSHLRGLWLLGIATEDEIENVKQGGDPPGSRKLAELLEEKGGFDPDTVDRIAKGVWPAVCDFTHTGIRVISAHLRGESIDPAFSDEEVVDVLQVSNVWASLAGIALFDLGGRPDLSEELGKRGVEIAQATGGVAP
ncbi:MAG: DUF6988 family protein [Pseudorhizobium sp.]